MLRYPVKLARDDNATILVTAPDLPEVSTFGEDAADALVRAADAIATALQGRITAREKIPVPSAPAAANARLPFPPLSRRSLSSIAPWLRPRPASRLLPASSASILHR